MIGSTASIILLTSTLFQDPVQAKPDRPAVEGRAIGAIAASFPPIFVERAPGSGDSLFHVQGQDKSLFFHARGVDIVCKSGVGSDEVHVDFVGVTGASRPRGEEPRSTVVSYFRGAPDQWEAGLRSFGRIVYENLWPGIDLTYAGASDRIKYEFVVAPGTDPGLIELAYRDAQDVTVSASGGLEVTTASGEFEDRAPIAYQDIDGCRVDVAVEYRVARGGEGAHRVRFDLGPYDAEHALVIDPVVLMFCGYIGGEELDFARSVAVDSEGNVYVTGLTKSEDSFPVEVGPDLTYNRETDAFIAKISADGTDLLYCGYIGGDDGDEGFGVAVDSQGYAYVTGKASSTESTFPVHLGPDLTHNGTADGFVAKVSPDGSELVYCGYIGGSGADWLRDIEVDDEGAAYVVGWAGSDETSLPVRVGPDVTFNGGGRDAFLAKVSPDGSGLVFCGYVGGDERDMGYGIAVDASGAVYVAGHSESHESTFPVRSGPDLTWNGNSDAFVAKVNADGSGLEYCGYIGGSEADFAAGVAVDAAGNAYVTGNTESDPVTFPAIVGPTLHYSGSIDAFVAKVTASGLSLAYCGYIGGSSYEHGNAIDVSPGGIAVVGGSTRSDEGRGFPVVDGPDLTHNQGHFDGFVARPTETGDGFVYCGYIGGGAPEGDNVTAVHVDDRGTAYVAGSTNSNQYQFPVAVGPSLRYAGRGDVFVARVADSATSPDLVCRFGSVNNGTAGGPADVLLVNDKAGDGYRAVTIGTGRALRINMLAPPAGPDPAPFALYAHLATPTTATVSPQPYGLGDMCLPTFLSIGIPKPDKLWNNAGHEPLLGKPDYPSSPAPTAVFARTRGVNAPVTLTLQGIIADNGSAGKVPASVTNAIILRIE